MGKAKSKESDGAAWAASVRPISRCRTCRLGSAPMLAFVASAYAAISSRRSGASILALHREVVRRFGYGMKIGALWTHITNCLAVRK